MRGAISKYIEFHQFEPIEISTFPAEFEIPASACFVGTAVSVAYRSDKLNPTTGEDEGVIDYIHEHQQGVKAFRIDGEAEGVERIVPAWIRESTALVCLGDCLEFTYTDQDGDTIEGHMPDPLPELYTTPNGKALLIIESKRNVVAMLWGGELRVEQRGIVG